MSLSALWLLLIGMGLITFGIRVSMVIGRIDLPPLIYRALRYVPFAVLSAIFVPELLLPAPNNTFDLSFGNVRLLAGVVAILVAARTRNVLLTILTGMIALWILQLLRGG